METYMSIEGLAKYLDVAVKTVRKWVLNRDVPFHKVMGVVRFRVSEIERWISSGGNFSKASEGGEMDGVLFAGDEIGCETGGGEADTDIETVEAGGEV